MYSVLAVGCHLLLQDTFLLQKVVFVFIGHILFLMWDVRYCCRTFLLQIIIFVSLWEVFFMLWDVICF